MANRLFWTIKSRPNVQMRDPLSQHKPRRQNDAGETGAFPVVDVFIVTTTTNDRLQQFYRVCQESYALHTFHFAQFYLRRSKA